MTNIIWFASRIGIGLLGSVIGIGSIILAFWVQDSRTFRDLWPRTMWEFGRTDPFASILYILFLAPILGFMIALKLVGLHKELYGGEKHVVGISLLLEAAVIVFGAALGALVGESAGITIYGQTDGTYNLAFELQGAGFIIGACLSYALVKRLLLKKTNATQVESSS